MVIIKPIQSVRADGSNGEKISAIASSEKNQRRKGKMSLSDREKFIVHLITVQVIGAVEKAPDAAYKVLETLKDARVRKLPEKEVEEIVKKTKIKNFLIGESLLKNIDKNSSLLKNIIKISL